MEQPKAVVRLAPGEVGFFDPTSLIHLTLSNPSAAIRPGQNIDRIRRAVKGKHLLLVSGSLEPETAVAETKPAAPVAAAAEPKAKPDFVEPAPVEPLVATEDKLEEVVEVAAQTEAAESATDLAPAATPSEDKPEGDAGKDKKKAREDRRKNRTA